MGTASDQETAESDDELDPSSESTDNESASASDEGDPSEEDDEDHGEDEASEADGSDENDQQPDEDEASEEESTEEDETSEGEPTDEPESSDEGEETTGEATILHLNLAGLDLNLLGLEVDLEEVDLDISAVPGSNRLLGNLLAAVAGLLDGFSGILDTVVSAGKKVLGLIPGSGIVGTLFGRLRSMLTSSPDDDKDPGAEDDDSGAEDVDASAEEADDQPGIGAKIRAFAGNLIMKLPIEKLVATVVQTVAGSIIKRVDQYASEKRGDNASKQPAEGTATDGGTDRSATNSVDAGDELPHSATSQS